MQLTIFGLPGAGKTTLFNALTHQHAQTAAYSGAPGKPNLGVVKVPDPRLGELGRILQPQRVAPSEITYVDLPAGVKGLAEGKGIAGEYLNLLAPSDALVGVVRAFEDPALAHPEGSVDAYRDIGALEMELAFADLAVLERRVERLKATLKSSKPTEREAAAHEMELLGRIKTALEGDQPIRAQSLTPDERKAILGYQFLTAKPLLLLLNLGEEQAVEVSAIEAQAQQRHEGPGRSAVALCGKLEMELAQMEEAEAAEFRQSLGLGQESALARVIRASYALLALVTFFTYTQTSGELHAWTVPRGAAAPTAAGRVHSDMERGFIRAEVVHYADLVKQGSIAECRKHGLLRAEGKTYLVQDGDFIHFLFH